MNKRIKKKHNRKIMIGYECIVNAKNPWNTNTPHWKRIKASGRKRKMYYSIHCVCRPNKNNRVYNPSLLQKALKEYTVIQHLHNGEVTKYDHIFR